MKETLNLHNAGHSIGLWLFQDTNPWFEFVLHTVLLVAPFAMALMLVTWLLRIVLPIARRYREHLAKPPQTSQQATGIFRYVLKHTRRSQFLLLAAALIALPLLYVGLELPKLIINNAISSGHFPIEMVDLSLSQTNYLFLLSGLYLVVILINGSLKYAISVHKGRVAESLLRRLRLTIYRHWRRDAGQGDRTEVIPMLVQEVEPVGGFAGDAFVLPLFQGGTFLTILAFMFVQDPVLGAAAITLLPVQLALIPRLQRKINHLARHRAREMRGLGGVIGREIALGSAEAGARRKVTDVVRRIAEIRFEIYRKKFFMKGLNNFIAHLTPFFFYTVGGYLVIEDRLSLGALVAVLTAHKDFSGPLKELLKYYQTKEDVRVRFEEVCRFLATHSRQLPELDYTSNALPLAAIRNAPQYPGPAKSGEMAAAASRFTEVPGDSGYQPCTPQNYAR